MSEKNVPETTTLTEPLMTEGQKTKVALTFTNVLKENLLSKEAGQYFAECGKRHMLQLVKNVRRDYDVLRSEIKAAKDGHLRVSVRFDDLMSGEFSFVDPKDLMTGSERTLEEVCSLAYSHINLSPKLIRLVYYYYREEEILEDPENSPEVERDRRQVITDLLPFLYLRWVGADGKSILHQNIGAQFDRAALRQKCLVGKRAWEENERREDESLRTRHPWH